MKYAPINSIIKKSDDRWQRINWIIIIFIACIGFTIIGLVFLGLSKTSGLYHKYFPLADATMEMRMEAINAYLWFEEMIGGDENTTMDQILEHMDRAEWYATVMIEGGKNLHINLMPSENSNFLQTIRTLQNLIKEQKDLLITRFESMHTSKPGSNIDKVYHRKLETFIIHSLSLEENIKKAMSEQYQNLKHIWSYLIVCFIVLFLISVTFLLRYERLRKNHYLKILRMQERIVISEKMALIGNLTTGIAHQINNPNGFISFNIPILREYLQGILPIIDEYAEKKTDFEILNMSYPMLREDLYKILENIENGSKRVNRIVSDLKEFSIKKDHLKRVLYDLPNVIRDALAFCDSKINKNVHSFKVNIPKDLPQLYCDPDIVKLIVINFLNNAVDSIDKKDSLIILNVKFDKKRKNKVTIEVCDNGSGIEEGNIDKIFNPFYSTKPSKDGTGMGLYLCKALSDLIGARIEVESVAGEGSTFRLITGQLEREYI